jgi:hypothetical protein
MLVLNMKVRADENCEDIEAEADDRKFNNG